MAYGKQSLTKGKAKATGKPLARKKAPPKVVKEKNENQVQGGLSAGGLQPGSEIWRLVRNPGGKRLYEGPQELWDACVEYFEWVVANPLQEAKLVSYEGVSTLEKLPRLRAMSIGSLCVFLDITAECWSTWRRGRDDLKLVIGKVEAVIFSNKFEAAAAGLMNAGIVARELGLIDKREQTGTVQVVISGDDAEL